MDSKYIIGDVVAVHGEIDGYITDVDFYKPLNTHVYFVETSEFADWFRASDLIKIHRIE